jgi:hypothetical protein
VKPKVLSHRVRHAPGASPPADFVICTGRAITPSAKPEQDSVQVMCARSGGLDLLLIKSDLDACRFSAKNHIGVVGNRD